MFFIAVSVALAVYFASWAAGQFRASHDVMFLLTSVLSGASGAGLTVYGAAFQRKTRHL